MKYRVGDRVRLNQKKLKEIEKGNSSGWQKFDAGTITQEKQTNHGYGTDLPDGAGIVWGVRWDAYDYGSSATNCHTADEVLLLPDSPDEDELAKTMASIGQAARKTMSTRRLP